MQFDLIFACMSQSILNFFLLNQTFDLVFYKEKLIAKIKYQKSTLGFEIGLLLTCRSNKVVKLNCPSRIFIFWSHKCFKLLQSGGILENPSEASCSMAKQGEARHKFQARMGLKNEKKTRDKMEFYHRV